MIHRKMRAAISLSSAPHEAQWHWRLLQPLTYLLNAVVIALTYPSWRTARVHWEPAAATLHACLRRRSSSVICYGWHEYELLTFLAFRDWPADVMPTGIAH